MATIEDELNSQLKRFGKELDRRTKLHRKLEPYYEGRAKPPTAVTQARMANAYRHLQPSSDAPWGSLIVDASQHRLEAVGLTDENKEAAERCWRIWQENQMDRVSRMGYNAALIDGRAFALVEPGNRHPEIYLDDSTMMAVEYRDASCRQRAAACRRWVEDDEIVRATLWRPDGVYKFEAKDKVSDTSQIEWRRREPREDDGLWPLPPVADVIPVVEWAVNRRLKPGTFGYARGEYEHCLGLIDRIHLLTFLGLVVALWQGFPLRGVIGGEVTEEILRDDDGQPLLDADGEPRTQTLPPFDAHADSVFQIEDNQAKLAEFKAADRENLSIFAELDQLSVVSKTPRHNFPLKQGMSNLSADAIRASEGLTNAKIKHDHKPTLGEAQEETLRIAGMLDEEEVELSPAASIEWSDHESRSLAERADAYSKLSDMPWEARAELALNAGSDTIARWQTMEASNPLSILARAAADPAPAPVA